MSTAQTKVQSIHYNQLNEVMSPHMTDDPIKPGSPATMYVGSDRYAMIVLEVLSPKRIIVAHMTSEDYKAYEDDPKAFDGAAVIKKYMNESLNSYYDGIEYSLRKNNRWMPKGSGMWETCSLHIGEAENYWDPSF